MTPTDVSRPAFTVVVMGYMDRSTVLAAVESVLSQVVSEPFELIVVTSGGDGTAELVRGRHPELVVRDLGDRVMPGAARNAGLEVAAGKFVMFMAADCVARPGMLDARLAAHRHGYDAVSVSLDHEGHRTGAGLASLALQFRRRMTIGSGEVVSHRDPRANGASVAVDVLRDMGGYEASGRIGEDTDLAHRLGGHQATIWFEPACVIGHRGPENLRGLVEDEWRRARRHLEAGGSEDRLSARLISVEARLAGRRIRDSVRALRAAGVGRLSLARAVLPIVIGTIAQRAARLVVYARGVRVEKRPNGSRDQVAE